MGRKNKTNRKKKTREIIIYTPEEINDLLERIFGNELLLEEILTYAIHTNDGRLGPKLLKNVRRVQKSFRYTTTRILKKLGKPAIKLTLTEKNSPNEMADVKERGKLDKFIQTFTTGHEGIGQFPIPFKLNLTAGFFCEENKESLLHCITRLGNWCLELEISYPKEGGTLFIDFTNLELPSLRKLSFNFHENKSFDAEEGDDFETFDNNARGMLLLQSILDATGNLKHFVHPAIMSETDIPQDFEFLVLPKTISILDLNYQLPGNGLQVLYENNLPNLSYLTLYTNHTPYEDELWHQTLVRFQDTLKRFEIEGLSSYGNPRQHTHLRFPIMNHLETVMNLSMDCELGPGDVSDLQERLPNLKCLKLTSQTEVALKKWIEKSCFENVYEVEVSIIDESFEEEDDNYFISPDIGLIKKIHKAFPNVENLMLTFNVSNTSGLSSIFQNMTKLETLKINFQGNLKVFSSDLFSSTFLCLPLTTVTGLRKNGKLKAKDQDWHKTSIRNLSELTTLVLWTNPTPKKEKSLLSEILFNLGFLKMKFLTSLYFYGKFKPTPKMNELWKNDGGEMAYFKKWTPDQYKPL